MTVLGPVASRMDALWCGEVGTTIKNAPKTCAHPGGGPLLCRLLQPFATMHHLVLLQTTIASAPYPMHMPGFLLSYPISI